MNTIAIKEMDLGSFQKYGRYAPVLQPTTPCLGTSPIRFFRDILSLGNEPVTVSNTMVDPMPMIVDTMEYHSRTGEGFMILDADAVICLGIATSDGKLPQTLEAFHLRQGVMVYINPGVWHYAPYPIGNQPINSLVLLPERTYALDCQKVVLTADDWYILK